MSKKTKKKHEDVISTGEIMHVFLFWRVVLFLSCTQIIQIFVQENRKRYKKGRKKDKRKKKKLKIPPKYYQTWKWFLNTFIVLFKFCHAIDVHTLIEKQLLTAMYGFGFNCQHLSSASSAVKLFV